MWSDHENGEIESAIFFDSVTTKNISKTNGNRSHVGITNAHLCMSLLFMFFVLLVFVVVVILMRSFS